MEMEISECCDVDVCNDLFDSVNLLGKLKITLNEMLT